MADEPRVRLAEVVAALSLGIDLGFGQPMEHVLRQCIISLRLAERLGLDDQQRLAVYYTSLIVNVGCHTDAHEQAKWFGDDIALKADKYRYEFRSMRGAVGMIRRIGSPGSPLDRLKKGVEFAVRGRREIDDMLVQHARLAASLARDLSLPEGVVDAISASYEMWDGRGWPGALSGEAVPIASRIAQVADFTEVAHRTGGRAKAIALARRRAGGQFDPAIVRCLEANAGAIFDDLDSVEAWQRVIASEPSLSLRLTGAELESVLAAIADFVDLKSPFTLGHSRAVAELASQAALHLELPFGAVDDVRRAALVSGWGRLAVSNAIWDKPGPLGAGEWERIRMHPYITERMLQQSESLAAHGRIAGAHRERMDGSGYPRGLTGSALPTAARILAAADAYQTKREPRPHRPQLPVEAAASYLNGEVRAGRLDASAVEAVLAAAGHRAPRRRRDVAGLTQREVEILRLIARGLSNRQIAERLVISPKTAGNHVDRIYSKIDASNRAAASLFAVRHGLLAEEVAGPAVPEVA